jgi:hypothetical protein
MNEPIMPSEPRSPGNERLDALFRAYHVACEPREVSVNFMPELWQKIEKVQNATFSFRRIAKSFVTAAAALSLVLALVSFFPPQNSRAYNITYVEALAAHNDALSAHSLSDSMEYVQDLIHPDTQDDASAGEI